MTKYRTSFSVYKSIQ